MNPTTSKKGKRSLGSAVVAAIALLAGAVHADSLETARNRIVAELRMEAFAEAEAARSEVREHIEWHAGRVLWHWEGAGGSPADRLAVIVDAGVLKSFYREAPAAHHAAALAPVLIAAWNSPGQRFAESARVGRVLMRLAEVLSDGAAASGVSADETAQRAVLLRLVEILAALDGRVPSAWVGSVSQSVQAVAATQAESTAGAMWRARAAFAVACLRRDGPGARAAVAAFEMATEERGFSVKVARDDPTRLATMAADTLAMTAWTSGTDYALRRETTGQSLRMLRSAADRLWRGSTFDPLVVGDHAADAFGGEALREAALRLSALGGRAVVPLGFLSEWESRDGVCPSAAAVAALRLWKEHADTVRLSSIKGAVRLADEPEDDFISAEAAEGRVGLLAVAFDTHAWVARDGVGRFNVYEGERAEAARQAWRDGFGPGVLMVGGTGVARPGWSLETVKAHRTPAAPFGIGAMASLKWSRGEAWLATNRAWGLLPGGFVFTVSNTKGRSAERLAKPWVCVPGRDRRTWLRIRLPRREGFDAVRLAFAPQGDRWRGVPPTVRVRISDDATNWTLVAERHGIVDPSLQSRPVESVTVLFDRVQARHISLAFPEGGVGRVVRLLEAEVLRTVRDSAGGVVQHSENLALATRGAEASAESSASVEYSAGHAIDGIRSMEPKPLSETGVGLFLVAANMPVTFGTGGHRDEWVLEEGAPRSEAKGVEWLHDGAAGYILSRPTDLVIRRLPSGWLGGSLAIDGEPIGVVVKPGISIDETERLAWGDGVAWRSLGGDFVWVELAEEGEGLVAAFDAARTGDAECEDVCCLVYRNSHALLNVAADWERRMRVSLDLPSVERVNVNSLEVDAALGDLLTFPLEATASPRHTP